MKPRAKRSAFRSRAWPVAVLAALGVAEPVLAGEHFELREIPTAGRTVAAELVDLDGDSNTDLLQLIFSGVPPNDHRVIRVYPNLMSSEPHFDVDLPPGSAIYDLGDVADSPGTELVLLRQNDIAIVSLRNRTASIRSIPIPGNGTIAPRDEERTIAKLDLVHLDHGDHGDRGGRALLVVQQLGQVTVCSADGRVRGQLDVGGVSSYFVFESPGLGFAESPIELNYTPARLSVVRVDEDRAVDIVAATRHDVRVFLQRPDGTFPSAADRTLPLDLVAPVDHIRRSGGGTAMARDIDGNGLADLFVSSVTGGITDATTTATVHLNRGGRWDLHAPDQTLEISARGSLTTMDLDGDGRPELIQMTSPFSTVEIIEMLLTRSIDVNIAVYRRSDDRPFAKTPWATRKLDLPISFETFAATGFLPFFEADLNGDGDLDLITSGNGERIDVYLGGAEYRYQKRAARQEVGASGEIRAGDFNGDGRTDLLLFDPRRIDVPIKLLRNRGTLPGSPPRIEKAG